MKQNIKYLFYILVMFLTIQGCKKDNDSFTSYLRGKIDGVPFECTSGITANTAEPSPSYPGDPNIRINGSWLNNSIRLMVIMENPGITPGTYSFQADKNRSATIYLGPDAYYAGPRGGGFSGLPPALAGSGSITFIEVSKHYVKGTFQFAAVDNGVTKTVTDGEFYIKRQ